MPRFNGVVKYKDQLQTRTIQKIHCGFIDDVNDPKTRGVIERVLDDFDSHQEKRLSSLGTKLKQQQDEVINIINTLRKVISKKINNAPTRNIAKDSMARINAVSHAHHKSGAPPNKGVKSPSKLLSPKYQSQSSLGEQNRKSSSTKCIHFINTITVEKNLAIPKQEARSWDVERDHLVDKRDESVYESLIEKMPSWFFNSDFKIEKGVIFDEEKPGSSLDFHVDDSWMTI
ncbi:hypothetical protein Tco_0382669 [Tanacetum coccineum]